MTSDLVLSNDEIIGVNSQKLFLEFSLRSLGSREILPIIISFKSPPTVIFFINCPSQCFRFRNKITL